MNSFETGTSAARLPPPRPDGHPEAVELGSGFRGLQFDQPLEGQFREEHRRQNLLRARTSTLIYLCLLGALTIINYLGGFVPSQESIGTILYVRTGILCPALAIILIATYWRAVAPHYQLVVAAAAMVAGVAVMWITAVAATGSLPQFNQMGNVLVLVYGCLFLGLLSRAVVTVAAVLVIAFFTTGLLVGISLDAVAFGGALLMATALMAVLSALRLEYLQRTTFLETLMLQDAARRDGLTGLFNRRSFEQLTDKLWRQARREAEPVQFLLIDLDYFKAFNDRYGHQAGDDCLKSIARIIESSASRPFDFCARYGGEEFALFVYGQPPSKAEALPNQIREAVAAAQIPHWGSDFGIVTVTIGAAYLGPEGGRSLTGLIQTADEALYKAKNLGRNRVVCEDAGAIPAITGSFRAAGQTAASV